MILLQDLRSCEDPVAGLMPDTVSVLYFLEEKETKDKQLKSLRGIVRFGAQATQSMSRGEAEEDGNWIEWWNDLKNIEVRCFTLTVFQGKPWKFGAHENAV